TPPSAANEGARVSRLERPTTGRGAVRRHAGPYAARPPTPLGWEGLTLTARAQEARPARGLAAQGWMQAHKEPEPGDVAALQERIEALEQRLDRVLKRLERTRGEN